MQLVTFLGQRCCRVPVSRAPDHMSLVTAHRRRERGGKPEGVQTGDSHSNRKVSQVKLEVLMRRRPTFYNK
jgi:hypothetical protein